MVRHCKTGRYISHRFSHSQRVAFTFGTWTKLLWSRLSLGSNAMMATCGPWMAATVSARRELERSGCQWMPYECIVPHHFINFMNFICFCCWASWIVSGGAGLWVCQFCKFAQQLLAKVRSESMHAIFWAQKDVETQHSRFGLLSLQAVLWSDRKQLAGQDTQCSCGCGCLPQIKKGVSGHHSPIIWV